MTSMTPNINRWRVFALLGVTYLITTIDLTIVNVSLPTIGRDLHFSATDLQWVVTAYALTFGGSLLLGGRFADLLGRRRILMAGLGLFTMASLGCALASGETILVAMRGAQGLGAALMSPAALSIVMNTFSEGAERNKALGIWGGLGAAGGTVGLIAGGVITRYIGWQYIFYLNVPIGTAVLVLAPRIVPDSRPSLPRRGFDLAGAVTGTGGLVLLVDVLSQAPQYGWGSTRTVVLLGGRTRAALWTGVRASEHLDSVWCRRRDGNRLQRRGERLNHSAPTRRCRTRGADRRLSQGILGARGDRADRPARHLRPPTASWALARPGQGRKSR